MVEGKRRGIGGRPAASVHTTQVDMGWQQHPLRETSQGHERVASGARNNILFETSQGHEKGAQGLVRSALDN